MHALSFEVNFQNFSMHPPDIMNISDIVVPICLKHLQTARWDLFFNKFTWLGHESCTMVGHARFLIVLYLCTKLLLVGYNIHCFHCEEVIWDSHQSVIYRCSGARFALKGCVNDAHCLAHLLNTRMGFRDMDIMMLTDDNPNPQRWPTRANMIYQMQMLLWDVQPGDSLFFSFSGKYGNSNVVMMSKQKTNSPNKSVEAVVVMVSIKVVQYTFPYYAVPIISCLLLFHKICSSPSLRFNCDSSKCIFAIAMIVMNPFSSQMKDWAQKRLYVSTPKHTSWQIEQLLRTQSTVYVLFDNFWQVVLLRRGVVIHNQDWAWSLCPF